MIGIIGAMAIEVEEILAKLEHPQTETNSGMDFVRGTIRGVDCVVARCNVCLLYTSLSEIALGLASY